MIRAQITIYLVEEDTGPDLPVRFTGLDLADYSSIVMNIKFADCTRLEKTVTPEGVGDPELGYVSWSATDLVEGRHEAEFELTTVVGSKKIRLPRKHTIILDVRKNLD